MSLKINREKSISKKRIIYKPNWEYILEKAFEVFFYVGWIIMTILLILNPRNSINTTTVITLILIGILLLISWFFTYKLLQIKISNTEKYRTIFIEILKEKFPELSIKDDGINMLRSKKSNGVFSWGKTLIVFFEKNEILINLTTLGRNEIKSPLHSIYNYLKLKRIEKEFYRKINGI